MKKKYKIGVIIIAVSVGFYAASPFVLFPVLLEEMSENAGKLPVSGAIFEVVSKPILDALEGDNFYYNALMKYSISVCNKYEGRCPGVPKVWPPIEDAT